MDVGQREDADREVGDLEVEAGLQPARRDVEVRRVAEPVERDDLLQRLDERERAEELDAARAGPPGRR